jgi:hypothetical protein
MALGLLSVGKSSTYFDPKRNSIQQRLMLNHLIEAEPDGSYPLLQVLQDRRRSFTAGSFFAVITPLYNEPLMQTIAWLNTHQMNIVHFWLAGSAAKATEEAWLSQLRKKEYVGYAVRALDELPQVLGGRVS